MDSRASGSEDDQWIVQPLIDAGLGRQEITVLLVRLGFEAIVRDRDIDAYLRKLVDGQPAPVRAAWVETIDRVITAGAGT